jgi:hypothetical protein
MDDDVQDVVLDQVLLDCVCLYPFWFLDGIVHRLLERQLLTRGCVAPAPRPKSADRLNREHGGRGPERSCP